MSSPSLHTLSNQAQADSVSHLNPSTAVSTVDRVSSMDYSPYKPPRIQAPTPTRGNQRPANSWKQGAWLAMTSTLVLFSVLNFFMEASSVESGNWHRGMNVAKMQQEFVQDYIDLAVMDETMGEEEYLPNKENKKKGSSNLRPAHAASDASFVPLADFVKPTPASSCPEGLAPAPILQNPIADLGEARKIPRIVHQTGKSPCLTEPFYNGALNWTFANHSFYFHDEQAVDDLLFNRDWPMFPQLKNAMECLKNAGGAAKADLWRYLVMWEYGGIYTDMDNLPGALFNETTITPDMDAFFLQEQGGWVSQYFFAVSPKHPMMFLAVHDVMHQMHGLQDTGKFYVPATTGPGSTKRAFLYFMRIGEKIGSTPEEIKRYAKPNKGFYQGWGNRTVTIEGTRQNNGLWVQRSAIRGQYKVEGWIQMNITDYQTLNKQPTGTSCVLQLHDKYMMEQQMEQVWRTRRW